MRRPNCQPYANKKTKRTASTLPVLHQLLRPYSTIFRWLRTFATPSTFDTTSSAPLLSSADGTVPVSDTTPARVFTWICVDLTFFAPSNSALTLVVTAVSSTFLPIDVEAPIDVVAVCALTLSANTTHAILPAAFRIWVDFIVTLLLVGLKTAALPLSYLSVGRLVRPQHLCCKALLVFIPAAPRPCE